MSVVHLGPSGLFGNSRGDHQDIAVGHHHEHQIDDSTPQIPKESQSAKSKENEQANSPLEITYTANEGVLIAAAGKQVLIDGLYRECEPDCAFPPADLLEKLEKAQPPFNKTDLILVSHLHDDHFHPQSVGLHLKHNPRATLIASHQINERLEKEFADYPQIKAQIKQITPPWKEKTTVNVNGIEVEVLGLRHVNERFQWIQNLGHVIKMGGKKLLHIGDADTAVENFASFRLGEQDIDIAFIRAWYLLYGSGPILVREHLKPKQIIAVHISPQEAEKTSERISKAFPTAISFTKILEKVQFF
ncbi:MAG: MBL fold metallo-hydrolase [Acidobacteriota bacterium]